MDRSNAGEVKSRIPDVVKTYHGNILRHPEASFAHGADGSDGRDVVIGEQRRKTPLLGKQLLGKPVSCFRRWVVGIKLHRQFRINLNAEFLRYIANRAPAVSRVGTVWLAAKKGKVAMAQFH